MGSGGRGSRKRARGQNVSLSFLGVQSFGGRRCSFMNGLGMRLCRGGESEEEEDRKKGGSCYGSEGWRLDCREAHL